MDWDGLGTYVSGNRRVSVISPLQPRIYGTTIRVRGFLGDSTKWKFRAHPETRFTNTGWETGEDRWFRYVSDTVTVQNLPSIKPRIFPSTGPLSRPTPYTFQVDMANARNRYNNQLIPLAQLNFVGIKGGSLAIGNWGGNWVVSDTTVQPNGYPFITRMNDAGVSGDLVAGDRIWSRTIIFPDSSQTGGIEFKYAAHYPGADTVNGGSQPMDNEAGFGQNRIFILSEQPVGFTPRLRTVWGVMGLVGIKENKTITPDQFRLVQNYPNPFNPSTTITFSLPSDQNVSLKIYNIMGEVVATLIDGFHKAGSFDVEFNASNLASGIYFYSLQSDNFSSTKKMMLMK
ncbi:MAG: hypothetical protein C0442_09970 [Chlorobiaceae bacterium]|nr:hypothetical protein [Chlorobiaceae bacterium]